MGHFENLPVVRRANRKTAWSFILIGLAVAIGAGLFAADRIYAIMVQHSIHARLAARGIAAEAKIIAIDRISRSGNHVYEISYIFYAMDARLEPAWFAKNAVITEHTYRRLIDADRVDILFDPLDPNVSKIERENRPPSKALYLAAGVTVLSSLIGCALLVIGVALRRRNSRPAGSDG